jgi:hypothetical protein
LPDTYLIIIIFIAIIIDTPHWMFSLSSVTIFSGFRLSDTLPLIFHTPLLIHIIIIVINTTTTSSPNSHQYFIGSSNSHEYHRMSTTFHTDIVTWLTHGLNIIFWLNIEPASFHCRFDIIISYITRLGHTIFVFSQYWYNIFIVIIRPILR